MVNRIIQIGEKSRDAERNLKRLPLDESALINDFRAAISKLDSHEQTTMVKSALRALDVQRENSPFNEGTEKSDVDEKSGKYVRPRFESISLVSHSDDSESHNGIAENGNANASEEIEELRKKIQELRQENEFLTTSLDELDKEHAQSLDTILAVKDQLSKKHESLQKAYEQLYVECNEAQTKLQLLESKSAAGVEANNNSISKKALDKTADVSEEKEVQTDQSSLHRSQTTSVQTVAAANEEKDVQTDLEEATNNSNDSQSNLEELARRVNEILKNSHLEIQPDESLFESLARQYVEANWKKEMLERKLTEVSRDLKQTAEMRDSLQMECDDMQANIESLLLQIEHLKSNLPSIPEASEERVASLETETESMGEEIKRLQAEHEALKVKHFELITTVSVLEGSLRNQENLEAEVRNTKQQLDIAKQRLDGASKNVENNENMKEDLSRRLHASLEENNQLRKRNDALEIAERQTQELLRVKGEELRNMEEHVGTIEKLQKQFEETTKELQDLRLNVKRMETELGVAVDARNELERDISAISEEKERLEAELLLLRESETRKEDSELLKNLRERLDETNREKNDLEYDILNMRKELDGALERIAEMEADKAEIVADNEKFERENHELLDQLASSHDDSMERIELLQTEMSLLAQEHSALKQDAATRREEVSKAREELQEAREKRQQLENELTAVKANFEVMNCNSKEVEEKERKIREDEANLLKTLQDQLSSVTEKCRQLEAELTNLRGKKEESKLIREKYELLEAELTNLRGKEEESNLIRNKCQSLEAELANLRGKEEESKLIRDKYQSLEAELTNLRGSEQELRNKYKSSEAREREAQILTAKLAETESRCRELEGLLTVLQSSKNEPQNANDGSEIIAALTESRDKLETALEGAKENAAMARETIEGLSQLVKEKDQEIENLKSAASATAQQKHSEDETALAALKAEREEFVRLVQEKHNTSLQYYAEIQRLAQLLTEQTATLQQAIAERDERTARLAEKEAEIHWAQNELQVVRQRLKSLEESQNYGETCGVVEHSVQIAQAAILNEKCNALEAALIQEQSSNRIMQNQLTESQLRESNAAKELERLRSHLVEMEASYTEEALIAEDNRKQLEAKLLQAEEKMQNTSTVYTSASIRANQQVETLQQQMALIVQQRDEIQSKLSAAEDKVLSHTASLTNLQIVLEQFQRDKESDIRAATEKIRQQLNMSYKEQEDLRNEIVSLRTQLSEAKECLQAASRLSEQLDKKSERIEELSQEVARLTELVNTADQRIQEARSSEEGKVDKNLVKNLLIGFLFSPTADKSSVLRVFATILEFDEAERERAGLNHPAASGGWFSGLLGSGGAPPTKDQEASLSAAFVRFLESESKPKPQLPALTISNSPLGRPGHSRQHSSSSTQSGLLLSSVTLPSFPDFVPSRNTGSILKEVLKDS